MVLSAHSTMFNALRNGVQGAETGFQGQRLHRMAIKAKNDDQGGQNAVQRVQNDGFSVCGTVILEQRTVFRTRREPQGMVPLGPAPSGRLGPKEKVQTSRFLFKNHSFLKYWVRS